MQYIILTGGGSIILYADILFLINFSMDFLSLYIALRIIKAPRRARTVIPASALGSLIGTAVVILSPQNTAGSIAALLVGTLTSTLMMCIACPKRYFSHTRSNNLPKIHLNFLMLLRESVILWGVGALLGGFMTFAVEQASRFLPRPAESGGGMAFSFAEVFIFCSAVSCAVVRLFSSSSPKKSAQISFTFEGREYTFTGLCDSGSFVCEPISGLPAIIVSKKIFGLKADFLGLNCCKTESDSDSGITASNLRLRVIPVKTAAGETLLCGFKPEKIFVDGKECEAVIAIDDNANSGYGGFDGIIPSALVK